MPDVFTITYYDVRYGDTYHIDVDREGNFLAAVRYVAAVGRDPIVFSYLADLPRAHRPAIERKIESWSLPLPSPL